MKRAAWEWMSVHRHIDGTVMTGFVAHWEHDCAVRGARIVVSERVAELQGCAWCHGRPAALRKDSGGRIQGFVGGIA